MYLRGHVLPVRVPLLLFGDMYFRYVSPFFFPSGVAFVLRPGETDAPETFKKLMAEANRLQDVYCGEFKTGLTGNELLGNILKKARELGIPGLRVYSHSLGYFLHEPGPLIGLPWEQVNNVGRGDVKLVPMSAFTAEMSVTGPVPEWGVDFRVPLEQDILFDGERAFFLAGRQTSFHLITTGSSKYFA